MTRANASWERLVECLRIVDDAGVAQAGEDATAALVALATGGEVDLHAEGPWRARYLRARAAGVARLQTSMMLVALGLEDGARGRTSMAIWLSRQYLGHRGEGLDEAAHALVHQMRGMSLHQMLRAFERGADEIRRQLGARRVIPGTAGGTA